MALTEMQIGDGPNLDAFGRLRVSNPIILFDSQLTYDNQPLLWDSILAAGGSVTYQAASGTNLLAIDATPNASAVRQTKAYHRYRPGHSLKITVTFCLREAANNVTKRVGYFDPSDGIYLQMDQAGAVSLVLRSSVSGAVVNSLVPQGSWNVDTMDGGGSSGINLNWTKTQNMIIDLQALYAGRVRVGFYLDGKIVYAHEFKSANVLAVPYIRTANLPIRYEIAAAGAGTPSDLLEICSSVAAEGGPPEERGFEFAGDTGLTARSVGATLVPVISVRPGATFNGLANHGQLIPEGLELLATSGSDEVRWVLLYNPTVTGGAWAAADPSSIAEVNITGTAVVGGIPISSGFLWAAAGTRLPIEVEEEHLKFPWVVDNAGPIPIALCAQDDSGSSELVASMRWRELR